MQYIIRISWVACSSDDLSCSCFQNFTLITLAIVLVLSHMTKVNQSNVRFENHCGTVGSDTDFSHDLEYVQNMDFYQLRLYLRCIDSCTPVTLM